MGVKGLISSSSHHEQANVLLLINMISVQVGTMSPAFHESSEARGIEISINSAEELIQNVLSNVSSLNLSPSTDSFSAPKRRKSLGSKVTDCVVSTHRSTFYRGP